MQDLEKQEGVGGWMDGWMCRFSGDTGTKK